MATLGEIMQYAEAITPHQFSDRIQLHWINEIEGKIQVELMGIQPDDGDLVIYTAADLNANPAVETVVKAPHDKLYGEYLCSRICEAEGEIQKANNFITKFNEFYKEFSSWFTRTYNPSGRRS